jgi:DNA-binding SARP family transcriptional activator
MPDVSLIVQLLGRPRIRSDEESGYRFRSQKSWALLTYLLLCDRPPSRSHLAGLLFDEADDPLRALRWNLAEVRRGLGEGALVEGDPVTISLPADAAVDVDVVSRGSWEDAVGLAGLGGELLEDVNVRGAAGFEAWLLSERRRMAAASEAILHEAALGSLSDGDYATALGFAERAAALSPLDENSQALVIRLHRRMGNPRAARNQYDAIARRLAEEVGTAPGVAVESALREGDDRPLQRASRTSINAILEAGAAAVAAGAGAAGVDSLRTAVTLADGTQDQGLRVAARLVLAEALIHSSRGLDEEGLEALHMADGIAESVGDTDALAQVRSELGYVDFLRGRYDRAIYWLTDALTHARNSPAVSARTRIYLGSCDSDRAEYSTALENLSLGSALAQESGDGRRSAYAASMVGRVHLLRGDLDAAIAELTQSIRIAEREHWLAFLPWPQAMLGEARLASGAQPEAEVILEQAFARACQLGDPCWEGLSARGLALVAAASGSVDDAFTRLADARARSNRLPDAYVWLDAHILDAQCALGLLHGHPDTAGWIDAMRRLASRTDMREMIVRSLVHGAALGDPSCAQGAVLLSEGIDNPALERLVASVAAA